MGEEKLLEVRLDKIQDVLQALKRDWPSSVQMYYFIWMSLEWLNYNPRLKSIKVYRYGAPKEELFLAVAKYQMPDFQVQRIMVHSLTNDVNLMKHLLLETDAINWSEDPIFEAVLEKHVPIIKELCNIKDKKCFTDGFFYRVWLPFEKQNCIEVSVPPDMYIGVLTEEHVPRVNDTWRYKFPGSDIIVRDAIVINHALGLFRKSDNNLVAWNTVNHFAGLGYLYTDDDERRKGYGSIITSALTKYLVDIEIDPIACIKVDNAPSLALFKKLGYKVTDTVTWILTKKIMDAVEES